MNEDVYQLIYRSPDSLVQVDIVGGLAAGQKRICLVVEEIEETDDEAGGLQLIGRIRRTIRRLEDAQEAIEGRYGL
jgi:hypothetical protein